MRNLMKHLLYEGTDIERQNMTWNIVGSLAYALTSMVLSFLVIWMMGDDQGGIFSFGLPTLGQQMFVVAHFGVRPFQITDGIGEYSLGNYLEHRGVACATALGAGAVFPTFMYGMGRYTASRCMILILLATYKIIDGYAGVYESELQRQGSLYLTGRSNFFRTLSPVSVFLMTLAAFRHLLFSCLAAVAAQAAGIMLFNLDVVHALLSVDWNKGERRTGRLSRSVSLLLISVFLDFYVFSAAKYAIDVGLNNVVSGYFSLIFMLTSVTYMVANSVIRPFLTRLTDLWAGKDYDCFRKELRHTGTIILGLTVLAVGTTAVLGKQMLSVMEMILGSGYEGGLVSYYGVFIIIVLGGELYALVNLVYYALVIMRRQGAILTVYLAAAATAAILSGFLVPKFGINGAAERYLLSMIGLVTGFGLRTVDACRNEKEENIGNGGSNI